MGNYTVQFNAYTILVGKPAWKT